MSDVGQLMRGDIELLGENLSVAGRLVEHIHIVGVLEDVLDLAGGKQVFDVLRDARGNAAQFAESLPYFNGIGGGLVFRQEQVHFVDIVAGGFMRLAVYRDAIPDLILHNQHTDFLELLSQLLNIVADDAAADIHICAVIEDVERAGNVDFKGSCDILRFLFVLPPQLVVEVFEYGHLFRLRVVQILAVDETDTAVNDGLFDRLQAVLAADNELA